VSPKFRAERDCYGLARNCLSVKSIKPKDFSQKRTKNFSLAMLARLRYTTFDFDLFAGPTI